MRIVRQFPPIYDKINKHFQVRGKPVIFCFGDRIYNPSNIKVGPELLAHEAVHSQQQRTYGVMDWWERYLIDAEFRLGEEVPAHHAEFEECKRHYDGRALERMLHRIGDRLSSPVYGSMITYDEARRLIGSGGTAPRAAL